ncbi:WhiB family transcriptional regulator [Nocardioides sp.]|uniref:WhiB family transcriptional regulator n=1 Tax=Nocardioides sp. TaxID=35761 RepID=UPI0037845CFC
MPCLSDPQSFTADKAKDRATAVRACRRCPAIEQCGRFADLNRERFYVWGGRDRGPRYEWHRFRDTPGDAGEVRDHGSGS